jgi:hypothetical protein
MMAGMACAYAAACLPNDPTDALSCRSPAAAIVTARGFRRIVVSVRHSIR